VLPCNTTPVLFVVPGKKRTGKGHPSKRLYGHSLPPAQV